MANTTISAVSAIVLRLFWVEVEGESLMMVDRQ